MSESRCLRKQTTSSEREVKRSAHCGRSEILEQGAKRHSEKSSDGPSNGWPKRPLARSIPLSYALKPYI